MEWLAGVPSLVWRQYSSVVVETGIRAAEAGKRGCVREWAADGTGADWRGGIPGRRSVLLAVVVMVTMVVGGNMRGTSFRIMFCSSLFVSQWQTPADEAQRRSVSLSSGAWEPWSLASGAGQ